MTGSQASTTAGDRQPLVNSTWKTRLQHGKGAKARMREKQPAGAFAVAVDYRCRDGKVSKSFTFFDSPSDLFDQTACMVQKNFYELIEPDQWTKLYLDIEHYVKLPPKWLVNTALSGGADPCGGRLVGLPG